MGKRVRRLAACFAGFASIILIVLWGAIWLPLPKDKGAHRLADLQNAVTIAFDEFGVPHIHAQSRTDAYAALGYATSRDRLFQMDLLRRKTAGRLAEVLGSALAKDDIWNRVMGFERVARDVLRQLPKEQQAVLVAYAAGVNQAMKDAVLWPLEFTVLGYSPEPWRPEDSILVALCLADLSYSIDEERTASIMRAALPETVVDFLTPDADCYNESMAPRAPDRCAPGNLPARDLAELVRTAGEFNGGATASRSRGAPLGSNGWVVGARKTHDGRSILANDMHLPLDAPNIWYLADLSYDKWRVEGLTLPGLPVVVSGTNGAVAWGMTSVEGDFADLIRIRRGDVEREKYRAPEGDRAFSARMERIAVRGSVDVDLEVKETTWGPVLPDALLGDEIAVRWTMLDPAATNLDLMDMDRVESVRDALSVLGGAGVPPLNALVADRQGSIAWTLIGKLPKRRGASGLFAEFWDDGAIGWDGYYSRDELPSIIDPSSGYIVNANQRMLSLDEFAPKLGHDYSGGFRAWRIARMVQGLSHVDEHDMVRLQLDTTTEFYRYYQALAIRALGVQEGEDSHATNRLIRALEAWNGKAEIDSLGLPLLVEFRKSLIESVLSPLLAKCRALDPKFGYDWSNADLPVRQIIDSGLVELLPDHGAGGGWSQFLRTELMKSASRLEQAYPGRAIGELRWGDTNHVEIAHPLGAVAPSLAPFLNMPREAIAGCSQCVRFYTAENGQTSSANVRMVVAPGHESEGMVQMAVGESGQFGSEHYADRQAEWVAGHSQPLRSRKTSKVLDLIP